MTSYKSYVMKLHIARAEHREELAKQVKILSCETYPMMEYSYYAILNSPQAVNEVSKWAHESCIQMRSSSTLATVRFKSEEDFACFLLRFS